MSKTVLLEWQRIVECTMCKHPCKDMERTGKCERYERREDLLPLITEDFEL